MFTNHSGVRYLLGSALVATMLASTGASAAPDPARVGSDVERQLQRLSSYGVFDNLRYAIDGPKVTLYGSATSLGLKRDAERAVKKVEGVEIVDNRIEELPASSFDDALRFQAYLAVYGGTGLDRYLPGGGLSPFEYRRLVNNVARFGIQGEPQFRLAHPVHIVVKNQRVELVGAVGSTFDKRIAELRVRQLPGIFSVTNNLEVGATD